MTSSHLSAVADPSTAQRGICQIQPLAMALPRKWALFEKITKTFLNNHPFYWCSIIFCLRHACWSWPVRVVSTCVWNGSLSEKKKRTRDPIYRTGHMDWLLLWVRFPKQRSSLHWDWGREESEGTQVRASLFKERWSGKTFPPILHRVCSRPNKRSCI